MFHLMAKQLSFDTSKWKLIYVETPRRQNVNDFMIDNRDQIIVIYCCQNHRLGTKMTFHNIRHGGMKLRHRISNPKLAYCAFISHLTTETLNPPGF